MPPAGGAQLVSLAEAALELGVTTRFLTILERRGQLRLVPLGRRVMVPRTEIDRLVRDGAPPKDNDEDQIDVDDDESAG